MTLDPFVTLGLLDAQAIDNRAVSEAFAAAIRRGVPAAAARAALEMIRVPARREAAALLAPSQTPTAVRILSGSGDVPDEDALALAHALLETLLAEADAYLSTPDVLPEAIPLRDIRQYVPVSEEDVAP